MISTRGASITAPVLPFSNERGHADSQRTKSADLDKPGADGWGAMLLRHTLARQQLVRKPRNRHQYPRVVGRVSFRDSRTSDRRFGIRSQPHAGTGCVKILFDTCVPRPLRNSLPDHDIKTTQEMGWDRLRNGELIQLAEESFEALITSDQSVKYQQNHGSETRHRCVADESFAISAPTRSENRARLIRPVAGISC